MALLLDIILWWELVITKRFVAMVQHGQKRNIGWVAMRPKLCNLELSAIWRRVDWGWA
jgi:hypothetical protein